MQPLTSPVKTNLQSPVDFVGRENELKEILRALGPLDRAWIISLTGVGGIGKTELALQAGQIAKQTRLFENVVWITAKDSWLTPEGIQSFETEYSLVSLDDLLDTIIEVLEMDPRLYRASPVRKKEAVLEVLHTTSCLLIVDNLETVKDRAVIQFLTSEFPSPCKSLITTRLGGVTVSDEGIAQTFSVAQTLVGQREIPIGPLSQEDAMVLFTRRAQKHELLFTLDEDFVKVREAVDKVARIPLAIEWVIGRMVLKKETLEDAITQFNMPNSEGLTFCFENLIKAVGSRSQKVLLAISIFVESVSWKMLREVTNIQPGNLNEALTRLVTASLIGDFLLGEHIDDRRFSVPAPTRLYVKVLSQSLAADLYREYYIRSVESYIRLLQNVDEKQLWSAYKSEQHNLLAIFSWCFENNELELVVRLAHVLSNYLQRLSLWDERVRVCELATLAAKNLGDKKESILFIYDAAEIHKARGRLDEAFKEFDDCEKDSKAVGDKLRAAHAHMQKGIIYYHQGKYDESVRTLEQSLEMHRANGDEQGVAQTLTIFARNELELGNLSMAEKYLEDGLNIKKRLEDQLGIAISEYDLGYLFYRKGDFKRAENYFKHSFANLDHIEEKRHLSNAKWYYALLQIDIGNVDAAERLLIEIISIEEPLHRDDRVDRARAKLAELKRSALYTDQVLAGRVVTFLMSYLFRGEEFFTSNDVDSTSNKTVKILSLLRERWVGDEEAAKTLTLFTQKPGRYKGVLEEILSEKLKEDKDLNTKLTRILAEIIPST